MLRHLLCAIPADAKYGLYSCFHIVIHAIVCDMLCECFATEELCGSRNDITPGHDHEVPIAHPFVTVCLIMHLREPFDC